MRAQLSTSTTEQGKSGLGPEAQRKAVADHLNSGSWELVGEYTEVESGKRHDRPEHERRSRLARSIARASSLGVDDRRAGRGERGDEYAGGVAPPACRLVDGDTAN